MLSADQIRHACLLYHSFRRLVGQPLISGEYPAERDLAEALYRAPFVLVSHGTQPDPIFNFANLAAQQLWELDWEAFTRLPSRLSAEPVAVAERQAMLAEARQKGYVSDYSGVRISSQGQRFLIKKAVLWNVHDAAGNYQGQAATFREWEFL